MKKWIAVFAALAVLFASMGAMADSENVTKGDGEDESETAQTPSKDTTRIVRGREGSTSVSVFSPDLIIIGDDGVPLGVDEWEVIQYIQTIQETEGDPVRIYQYNANTTKGIAEMISENADGKSEWVWVDATVILDGIKSGDLTLETIVPFAEGDKVKVVIGNFMGPGGAGVYEPGETGWATPDDEHNNDEIKWMDTETMVGSDNSVTISLDGKVESEATSVLVMLFKDMK